MPSKRAPKNTTNIDKPSFEAVANEIRIEIGRRRSKWRATNIQEWDDVAQELFIRAYNKYDLFDPSKGPLQNWLNRLISRFIKNKVRDLIYRKSRPCLGSDKDPHLCAYNGGGNVCTWNGNPSGIQCAVCPVYKAWYKKKGQKHNVCMPLPMENHLTEVDKMQSDFTDIEGKKKVLDEKIIVRLGNRHDAKMYKLLYIDNLSEIDVGNKMGYRPQGNSDIPGYQVILKFKKRVLRIAKEIVANEDLF